MATNTRRKNLWISNNKFLVGNGGKKLHARNPNFDTDETHMLISLWGDPKVQKTLITTHKKSPIIEKLAQTMRQHGYHRSPEEINTRIKNLKCLYNRIKKDVDSGFNEKPTWKHYYVMDEIMNRPIFGRPAAQERVRQYQLKQEQVQQYLVTSLKEDGDDLMDDDEDIDEDLDEDYMDDDDEEDDDIGGGSSNQIAGKSADAKAENAQSSKRRGESKEQNSIDLPITIDEIKTEDMLVVPKEEPIDVEDIEINEEQMTEYQASKQITKEVPKRNSTASPASAAVPTSIMSQNIIQLTSQPQFVMSTNTTTTPGGKISLVPTNFLLKSQSQPQAKNQITFKSPQIMYTSRANTTATTNSMTVPIQATSNKPGMPMKVLLVNRLQNPSQNSESSVTVSSSSTPPPPPPPLQPHFQIRPPPNMRPILPKSRPLPLLHVNDEEQRHSPKKSIPMKYPSRSSSNNFNSPNFRVLMQQLLRVEMQNLEVNRQRLAIDREKLEFEKTMGEKILLALAGKLATNDNNTESKEQE